MAPPEPQPQEEQEDHQATINRNVAKSRVKNSSRRMFLDDSVSDEGEEVTEKSVNEEEFVVAEEESPTPRGEASENSWMCPLASDELPLSPSDTEMEESHSPDARLSPPVTPLVRSKKCSGVILKLRRLFGKGLSRKTACYQAVSDSGTLVDPPRTPDRDKDVGGELELHRRSPQRWRRTGNFYKALRPLSSSAQRKRRSLLKIKYCPYLSACHSAEHRRRWVLRSAVQRARRAMRFPYPDLVGKRIRHLYEEHDKSEVWYRGEVLRVHEANANPLKTIFEVRYDSEPEWKYYLELLIDYEKGWLKVED